MVNDRAFYLRDTVAVARQLIGAGLFVRCGKEVLSGRIVETEAYCGPEDLACHAARGRTARTEVMFGEPGHAYVYMIYGMYFCLNLVTREAGRPEAVLIRGVELPDGTLLSGPGKTCRHFGIDKRMNGADITGGGPIWTEKRRRAFPVVERPRVGVDYAGEWKDAPLRFILADPKKPELLQALLKIGARRPH